MYYNLGQSTFKTGMWSYFGHNAQILYEFSYNSLIVPELCPLINLNIINLWLPFSNFFLEQIFENKTTFTLFFRI